ncbi:MAG: SurA N-terminal domain-containing protein [Verrucomicrobiales bacterium]
MQNPISPLSSTLPRQAIPAILLGLSLMFTQTGHGQDDRRQVVDGLAAMVNGKPITFSQVQEISFVRERTLAEQFRGEEYVKQVREVRQQALQDLIDRELVVQEFLSEGLQIPDYVIEDRIRSIVREDFENDQRKFLEVLKAQGFTPQRFRELERDRIIVQAMRQRVARVNSIPTPAEIEGFYRRNISQYQSQAEIRLSMITIYQGEEQNREANRRMADEIRAKVIESDNFGRMALMYSEDSMREMEGDWGWIDESTLNPELSKVAFGLKPGEVSEVLELGNAYYILRVEERRGGVTRSLSSVRSEIHNLVLQEKRQEMFQKHVDNLRTRAAIVIY